MGAFPRMHKSLKYAKMAVMHARQSRPSQIALANSRSSTLGFGRRRERDRNQPTPLGIASGLLADLVSKPIS